MGLRGRKPVDVKRLKGEASEWASFLYTLRDGQSGFIQGPWQKKPIPVILIPVSEDARILPREMKLKEGWLIFRPIMPAPKIWDLLKRARSPREIRKASHGIRKWMTEQFGPGAGRWLAGDPPVEYAGALDRYAEKVLIGKRLPSYAKTDRPSSDDKRVEFLSKVLAGARFGLAPITSAKRLSHWHFPKDWAETSLKEHIRQAPRAYRGRLAHPSLLSRWEIQKEPEPIPARN